MKNRAILTLMVVSVLHPWVATEVSAQAQVVVVGDSLSEHVKESKRRTEATMQLQPGPERDAEEPMGLTKRQLITSLVRAVVEERMSPGDALSAWPGSIDDECDTALIALWHELTHFAADYDLRVQDKEYDEWCRASLLRRLTDYVANSKGDD